MFEFKTILQKNGCDRDSSSASGETATTTKLPSGRVCWRNRRFIRPLPTEGGDPKEEMMTSDERHVHFEDEVFPPSPTSRRSVRQKRFSNHLRDFV